MRDGLEGLLTEYANTLASNHPNDTEALLCYLRSHGCSVIDSIKVLMMYQHVSLAEAKEQVHLSVTWADMRKSHDQIHDIIEQAAQELSDLQNWDR
jgi:hypothetical protein